MGEENARQGRDVRQTSPALDPSEHLISTGDAGRAAGYSGHGGPATPGGQKVTFRNGHGGDCCFLSWRAVEVGRSKTTSWKQKLRLVQCWPQSRGNSGRPVSFLTCAGSRAPGPDCPPGLLSEQGGDVTAPGTEQSANTNVIGTLFPGEGVSLRLLVILETQAEVWPPKVSQSMYFDTNGSPIPNSCKFSIWH